ncbi:MAG: formate dehydrogenase accessory sulfurtransferase FdhD [Clostridia bacterium]|nr:formate dehydrogenase accessory sulfurtransferase FdhD [Clostridia bacterium]
MNLTDSLDIIRYSDGETEEVSDLMVNEASLSIHVNGEIVKELLCSPAELEELALGYLVTQGYISDKADVLDFEVDDKAFVANITLKDEISDGKFGLNLEQNESIVFKKGTLLHNLVQFYGESTLQKATAGVHRCALCDDSGIIYSSDDISRHCAFDKIIGHAVTEGITLSDKYVITSGRVPLDMIKKVNVCGIPMIVSRTAPTISAANFARDRDITLLGFARENRFNIYSGFSRII